MVRRPSSVNQRPPSPLEEDEPDLIGMRPEFDGDRANALSFLTDFEVFIELNRNTEIAKDPFMRATYFLSILRGSNTAIRVFVRRNVKWLFKVESNPGLLPEGMNVWEALEADFKKSFEDYLGPQIARNNLRKLRMKDDRLEEYIAEFEKLACRANCDFDERSTIDIFAGGLRSTLAKACFDNEVPETFDQWTSAARSQYPRWQAINRIRGGQQAPNNRKAITKEEKERYRREGRCFHCGRRGHLVRDCRDRRPRIRTTDRI